MARNLSETSTPALGLTQPSTELHYRGLTIRDLSLTINLHLAPILRMFANIFLFPLCPHGVNMFNNCVEKIRKLIYLMPNKSLAATGLKYIVIRN